MLKGQVSRALQEVKGAQDELERVQRDDSIMALINLSVRAWACGFVHVCSGRELLVSVEVVGLG